MYIRCKCISYFIKLFDGFKISIPCLELQNVVDTRICIVSHFESGRYQLINFKMLKCVQVKRETEVKKHY